MHIKQNMILLSQVKLLHMCEHGREMSPAQVLCLDVSYKLKTQEQPRLHKYIEAVWV